MHLEQMTGAAFSVPFGGREYLLSPVTLNTFGELNAWAMSRPLAEAANEIAALGKQCGDKERKRIMDAAFARIDMLKKVREGRETDQSRIEEAKKILTATIESEAGIAYLLWLLLRKEQPEMTPEKAGELINLNGLAETMAIVDRISEAPIHPADKLFVDEDQKKTGYARTGLRSLLSFLKSLVSRQVK